MKKYMKVILSVVLMILSLTITVMFSSATSADETLQSQTDKKVVIYTKDDYKGNSKEFKAGDYSKLGIKSKSIEIPDEYVVTAYSEENFKGKEYYFVESQSAFFRYDFGTGFTVIKDVKSMKVRLIESEEINITDIDDAMMNQIMIDYAPRIWMAKNDPYEACSMEYVFEHFYKSHDDNGYNRINTIEQPKSPFDILDTYYGDQENAKGYAYWLKKDGGYIDISYFQFCPFDSGKYIHLIFHNAGAHPGDWEHMSLRFMTYERDGQKYMRPVKVAFPAHTFAALESWEDLEMYDSTHMEIYCAAGTHGMYPHAGNHVYMDLAPIERLTDVCNKGTAWDLFAPDKLETFEHDYKAGSRALAGSKWAGLFGYSGKNPESEAIKHWGNKQYFPLFLGGGPDAPQYKTEMHQSDSFK